MTKPVPLLLTLASIASFVSATFAFLGAHTALGAAGCAVGMVCLTTAALNARGPSTKT